ncbi:MAG: ribosome biogenesis GTPase Der [Bacteroidetes bacterium]|nr:ribosome biogenesis GTPase Der [Bacteroidota bacterium]MBV6461798.1 GTPase Der [Flavobacteriales bacterium]WKZ75912.1 MAG: ribosome biogenesis GTPase Der [Vicingaceae bacterium]MCL4816708.1 ribosome biogenesis GTPase Der [Flavobacteriales bacterium]NOG95590.1 ribosome biogenesis GTPase Der [Bacteroidota bacterium]
MANIVAIVGRPNVGKSTLFNRLTESRSAIVDEISGVTRDRHYGLSEWGGKQFSVIDTGGYISGSDDIFEEEIRKQVQLAVEECDVIIFVVDVNTGITDLDEKVADLLRKSKKKIVVVSNKVDNSERQVYSNEFYSLGLGEVYSISAINGSGTGELLDELTKEFSAPTEKEDDFGVPYFAVIGRPNVGKSSLTNMLLGNERNIVTPIAGTTRDSISTRYKAFGFDFYLVDTAGLRKKAKVNEDLEFYSVMRTVRAIENSDVCIMMIDAQEGIQQQDLSIISLVLKNNKGIVIAVNKWDLIEKSTKTAIEFETALKSKLAPFTDVQVIFTSVLEKQRVLKTLEAALQVYENRKTRIPTHRLNEEMLPIIEAFPPPALKGKYIKIKFCMQLPMHYPAFVFFCNLPQYVKEPYKRFLENKLREKYNFTGVPIKIFMRKK